MEKLKERLKKLNDQRNILDIEINNLKQEIAYLSTDLKVGDIVTFEGSQKKWELSSIKPGYDINSKPKYYGRVIKKDGTPGLARNELYFVPWNKSLIKVG